MYARKAPLGRCQLILIVSLLANFPLNADFPSSSSLLRCEHYLSLLARVEKPLIIFSSAAMARSRLRRLLGEYSQVMNSGERGIKGPAALTDDEHLDLARAIARTLRRRGVATRIQLQNRNPDEFPHYAIVATGPVRPGNIHFLARLPERFRQRFECELDFGFRTVEILHSLTDHRVPFYGRASFMELDQLLTFPLEDLERNSLGPIGTHEIRHAVRFYGKEPQVVVVKPQFRDGAKAQDYYGEALTDDEVLATYPYQILSRIHSAAKVIRKENFETNRKRRKQLRDRIDSDLHNIFWDMRLYSESYEAAYLAYDLFLTAPEETIDIFQIPNGPPHFELGAQLDEDKPPFLLIDPTKALRWISNRRGKTFRTFSVPLARTALRGIIREQLTTMENRLMSVGNAFDTLLASSDFSSCPALNF